MERTSTTISGARLGGGENIDHYLRREDDLAGYMRRVPHHVMDYLGELRAHSLRRTRRWQRSATC